MINIKYHQLILNFGKALLTLIASWITVSCASIGNGNSSNQIENNEFFVDSFPDFDINQMVLRNERDILKINDIVDVNFHNIENLSDEYVVNRMGEIVFPLIGALRVDGLSTADLQSTLVRRYEERYLQNPSISIKLSPAPIGTIIVDGAVQTPGSHELTNPIFLTEAIALSEGLTMEANSKEVYIVRNINNQSRILKVDVNAIRQALVEDVKVVPGDNIFIPESFGRIAFREFLRTVPLLNTAVIFTTR